MFRQFWYAQVKKQQFKLAGAIRRMMHRKLSMAWEQWQFWYGNLGGDIKIFGARNGTYVRSGSKGNLPCHNFPSGVNHNIDHDARIDHHHHESPVLVDPLPSLRYEVVDGTSRMVLRKET